MIAMIIVYVAVLQCGGRGSYMEVKTIASELAIVFRVNA
jgi:hypothetical protein